MTETGVVQDPMFMEHDTGRGHPERAERLEYISDYIKDAGLDRELYRVPLRKATYEELFEVHTAEHIKNVEWTAGRAQTYLDGDTPASAKSYDTALYAAGSLLNCMDLVLLGEIKNAFALIRPPGHHAESNRAMGFCLFNNIAVAAKYAIGKHGLKRILLVDFDVHHGNGTQDTFYDSEKVLYFSTHRYPFYPGSGYFDEVGAGAGEGYTVNVPLPGGCGDGEYDEIFQEILVPIAEQYQPELLLCSAGFDIHRLDPLGGMRVSEQGMAKIASHLLALAEKFCGSKMVLTLEGGYHLEGEARSVVEFLMLMTGKKPLLTEKFTPVAGFEILLEKVAKAQRGYWKIG